MGIQDLTYLEQGVLLRAIAKREGNISQLCLQYGCSKIELREYAALNRETIEELAQPEPEPESITDSNAMTPTQLDELWITKKFERVKRLQTVADLSYILLLRDAGDSTLLREYRSYLMLVANELGQLLNRGAGDSADAGMVTYAIEGVDMEKLR